MESILIARDFLSFNDFRDICIQDNIDISNISYLKFKEKELDLAISVKYPYILHTLWDNEHAVIGALKCCCVNTYSLVGTVDNINPYIRYISYITINPDYQHKGYSKKLIRGFFEFLNLVEINDKIYLSPYTKNGFNYLRKNLFKIANQYNIQLVDSNYCFES